ncbi:MAG TPA: GNAT family N-acetyltransferase [Anaerolineales bacterium]|nr:GNAT family N-acetyltransferase [Anaerolineales bacterium]HLE92123.1 GNAT family N-acetyltransferase [Anaerolineales bacterium]
MLPEQIKNFREMVTLKDGAYVLLRPMNSEDEKCLLEFYSAVSDDDMRYSRHYVKDPALIHKWCEHLDYSKVLPILAFVKDHVVGSASLHFFEGAKRHIGEVRLFLAKDFRRRGLGMKMIKALIDLARKHGLSILIAEVIAEQTKVVKAFEMLGFKSQATLDDYFLFPDGDSRDVVLMTMPLRAKTDEF